MNPFLYARIAVWLSTNIPQCSELSSYIVAKQLGDCNYMLILEELFVISLESAFGRNYMQSGNKASLSTGTPAKTGTAITSKLAGLTNCAAGLPGGGLSEQHRLSAAGGGGNCSPGVYLGQEKKPRQVGQSSWRTYADQLLLLYHDLSIRNSIECPHKINQRCHKIPDHLFEKRLDILDLFPPFSNKSDGGCGESENAEFVAPAAVTVTASEHRDKDRQQDCEVQSAPHSCVVSDASPDQQTHCTASAAASYSYILRLQALLCRSEASVLSNRALVQLSADSNSHPASASLKFLLLLLPSNDVTCALGNQVTDHFQNLEQVCYVIVNLEI